MTDNCEHCGLAYKPGLHLEIGCLARQVVNLRADLAAVMEEKATVWKQLHEARAKLARACEVLTEVENYLHWRTDDLCGDDMAGDRRLTTRFNEVVEKVSTVLTQHGRQYASPDTPPFDESAIWERCADYAEEHWKESGGYIAVQMRERAKKIRALAEKDSAK